MDTTIDLVVAILILLPMSIHAVAHVVEAAFSARRARLDAEADEAAARWLEEQALGAAESRVLPESHHLDLSHSASREDDQSRANRPSPSIPKE